LGSKFQLSGDFFSNRGKILVIRTFIQYSGKKYLNWGKNLFTGYQFAQSGQRFLHLDLNFFIRINIFLIRRRMPDIGKFLLTRSEEPDCSRKNRSFQCGSAAELSSEELEASHSFLAYKAERII